MTTVSYSLEWGTGGLPRTISSEEVGDVVGTASGFFVAGDPVGLAYVTGRGYSSSLVPLGNAVPISSLPGTEYGAAAALLAHGNVVTAYESDDATIYFSLTTPTGAVVKSSTHAPGTSAPDVAALNDGRFVVASYRNSGTGLNPHYSLTFKVFNENGVGVSPNTTIGSHTSRSEPSVAGLKTTGGFVLAFEESTSSSDPSHISFAIFNADLDLAGSVTPLSSSAKSNTNVEAIGLADGGFALAWQTDGWDSPGNDVALQIFNATGTPRSGLIRANSADLLHDGTETDGFQGGVTLTQTNHGEILLGWSTNDSSMQQDDLRIRAFDRQGHALTGVTKVTSTSTTEYPLTLATAAGKVGLFWSTFENSSKTVGGLMNLVRTSAGTKNADEIKGDELIDHIAGKGGKDRLSGGDGADRIDGGKGADKMHAGRDDDRDVFVFGTGESGDGKFVRDSDHIYQFDTHAKHELVWDKIDLSALGVKWQDISLDDHRKNVTVSVDYKGSGKADMAVEVMKVDDLHKADFIL